MRSHTIFDGNVPFLILAPAWLGQLDWWDQDSDSVHVLFPEAFPFFGSSWTSAWVNSNGSLGDPRFLLDLAPTLVCIM